MTEPRPFRRWLIEGLVIVASILVAFALDAWWDDRGQTAREREALTALGDELRDARVELDSVMDHNRRQAAASAYLVGLGPDDLPRLPVDSLLVALGGLRGGMTFDPSLGATDAIIAGGLDAVTDVELRARIAAWPGILREIEVDQENIVVRWEKVSDALVDAGLASRRLMAARAAADGGPTEAEVRELAGRVLGEPGLRQRVAALGLSLMELVSELREVEIRLDALQAAVASELASR